LLPRSLESENVNIKIYKAIILPVVLYGCKAWSLTLRKEYRLRVFENRVLSRIFGPKRMMWLEGGKNWIMRGSIICTVHQILAIRIIK
jgi:hypothetical protein